MKIFRAPKNSYGKWRKTDEINHKNLKKKLKEQEGLTFKININKGLRESIIKIDFEDDDIIVLINNLLDKLKDKISKQETIISDLEQKIKELKKTFYHIYKISDESFETKNFEEKLLVINELARSNAGYNSFLETFLSFKDNSKNLPDWGTEYLPDDKEE